MNESEAQVRAPTPGWITAAIGLLRLVPKNGLSRLVGRCADLPLPRALRTPLLRGFGRAVGVDFSEVRDPLDSFDSLQSFFTRALREEARPIAAESDAFVSPCDGAWGEAGTIRAGRLLQVKGRPYALADLLGGEDEAKRYEGGCFATLYLAPRDYHRFHTPCAVRVERTRHIPGRLWPVNRIGLEGVPALFAENERICAWMTSAVGEGEARASEDLCLVAVGATVVGRIRLAFDDLVSNRSGARTQTRRYAEGGVALAMGAEWGRFEFGSTIVLVAAPGRLHLELQPPGTPVRQGVRIGSLLGPDASGPS